MYLCTAGVTTVAWTVELMSDVEDEPTEKFKILLRTPTNALLGDVNRAVVHVLNVVDGLSTLPSAHLYSRHWWKNRQKRKSRKKEKQRR